MRKQHWQDWLCALVGLWMVVTPWVLPHQDVTVSAEFLIVGALVVVLAVSELSAFRPWKEWAIAAMGTWLFLVPRLMSFESTTLTVNAAVCGLAIIALAGWTIGDAHEILPRFRRTTRISGAMNRVSACLTNMNISRGCR